MATEETNYEDEQQMPPENEHVRFLPNSELDLNLMMTDSVWGRPEVSNELKEKLAKYFIQTNSNGKSSITKQSLWGLLGFYTRDMRLGNLSSIDGELYACRYYIDLANDLLQADMIEPFLISLSRAATILETSQSKRGFLRTIMNTLTQHHIQQNMEPPKKSLFGGGGKKDGSGGY
jgi:hypothetical protein